MVASALFVWEPWPFTSFRLFSHLRADAQTGWTATAVRSDGVEVPYPVDSLDEGFRNSGFRMAEFAAADQARQDELCRVWFAAAPEAVGGEVVEVRIYERHWTLTDRGADRARRGIEKLEFKCTSDGVRVAA